tara:strand:+ start:76 stop:435 length:360 start_codon:yes stop_codon:yes gene_type:complete
MSNPSKEKGTRWESACADYLRASGFYECYRMAQTGEFDAGDLGGVPEVAFECRDRARLNLAENVDDAKNRALAKKAKYGVTIMKRRNRPTKDAYVAMDFETFVRFLLELTQKTEPNGHQ